MRYEVTHAHKNNALQFRDCLVDDFDAAKLAVMDLIFDHRQGSTLVIKKETENAALIAFTVTVEGEAKPSLYVFINFHSNL